MLKFSDNSLMAFCVALLTGVLYAVSVDVGPLGPLVLIAPVPVLVYALTSNRLRRIFCVSFLARAMGAVVFIYVYAGTLPVLALIIATLIWGLEFAVLVLLARWTVRQLPGWIATLSFPVFLTASEFLMQLISPHGSFGALGYALSDIPFVTQIASVGGVAAVSFIAALIPMMIAMLLYQPHQWRSVLGAGCLPLVVVSIIGAWRLSLPYDEYANVGVAAIDSLTMHAVRSRSEAQRVSQTYKDLLQTLRGKELQAVVLPEKVFVVNPEDHAAEDALQAAANDLGTVVAAGFDETTDTGVRRNSAIVFRPNSAPLDYSKQRIIPGLESEFIPGNKPLLFGHRGVAICKDMDFPSVIRKYGQLGVNLLLVPAWDFKRDGHLHSRMAILRGVENGFAIARAAADGKLTVSDAFGRIIAEATTSENKPVMLTARVGLIHGGTIYSKIGDAFGWGVVDLSMALLLWLAVISYSDRTGRHAAFSA